MRSGYIDMAEAARYLWQKFDPCHTGTEVKKNLLMKLIIKIAGG
jgi:hypothetical protein